MELDGLAVDTDLRWALLTSLVAAGRADDGAIDAELVRDNTAAGQEKAATCRAARPTAEAKAQAWASVIDSDALTNYVQDAVIAGFNLPDHRELLKPYVGRYFDALKGVWETRSHEIAQQLIVGLYPSYQVEPATLEATDAWLASAEPAPALARLVVESRAGVERALKAQEVDRAAAARG